MIRVVVPTRAYAFLAIGVIAVVYQTLVWWGFGPGIMQYASVGLLLPLLSFAVRFYLPPRRMLIVPGLCSLCAGLWYFGLVSIGQDAVVVARLQEDPREVHTRLLQDRMNLYFEKGSSSLSTRVIAHEVQSKQESQQWLEAHPEAPFLIWGTPTQHSVSFPPRPALRLGELGAGVAHFSRLARMQLIDQVPHISFPQRPIDGTADFIARLASGLQPALSRQHAGGIRLSSEEEVEVKSAAVVESPWAHHAHQGYAWFVLGNSYLYEALASGSYREGPLPCAIEAYRRAVGAIKGTRTLMLLAAVKNNNGIAFLLKGVAAGNERALDKGMALLKESQQLWSKIPPGRQIGMEGSVILENRNHARGLVKKFAVPERTRTARHSSRARAGKRKRVGTPRRTFPVKRRRLP